MSEECYMGIFLRCKLSLGLCDFFITGLTSDTKRLCYLSARLSPWTVISTKFHTLYDVLWGNRLLFRLVANLIGFRRYKVNEFSAAVHDQLSGVVGHPDVRESLFDHLIYSSSGDSEIIIVARRGSHRTFLPFRPQLLNSSTLVHHSAKISGCPRAGTSGGGGGARRRGRGGLEGRERPLCGRF